MYKWLASPPNIYSHLNYKQWNINNSFYFSSTIYFKDENSFFFLFSIYRVYKNICVTYSVPIWTSEKQSRIQIFDYISSYRFEFSELWINNNESNFSDHNIDNGFLKLLFPCALIWLWNWTVDLRLNSFANS